MLKLRQTLDLRCHRHLAGLGWTWGLNLIEISNIYYRLGGKMALHNSCFKDLHRSRHRSTITRHMYQVIFIQCHSNHHISVLSMFYITCFSVHLVSSFLLSRLKSSPVDLVTWSLKEVIGCLFGQRCHPVLIILSPWAKKVYKTFQKSLSKSTGVQKDHTNS